MTQGFQKFTKDYVKVLGVLIGLTVLSSILLYSGCGMTSSPNTPANPTPTPTPTPPPDTTPPTSVITSPTTGATVFTGTTVTISGTASDAGGGTVQSTQVSVDGGVTWNPATGTSAWSFAWSPTLPGPATIKSRAIDNSGNVQNPPTEINAVVVDMTPPTVTSFSPAPGAVNVSLYEKLNVTFSEQMDLATLNNATVALRDPSGALTPATVSYNASSRAVTLEPTAPLAGETTYTAVVKGGDTGVKDLAGNPLAADLTWSFTTVTPPRVLSITPARDATNISLDVTPAATFSQALDPTTVNSSTVALTDAAAMPVNSKILYVRSVDKILIVPDAPLQYGQTYTMTLKGGPGSPRITNLAGTPLASDFTWSFTTVSSDTGACASVSFNVTPRIGLPSDEYSPRFLVKDFNQDSILDLVTIITPPFSPKRVSFFPGASDGGFGSPINTLTLSGASGFINDVTAGDFNDDGALDIVAIGRDDFNTWSVWVILNNGAGGFASPARYDSSKFPGRASAGDFNGDGKTDLVATIIDDDSTTDGLLFLNDGTGSFGQPQEILRTNSFFSSNSLSVTPTDLDGDGNLDLVFLYELHRVGIYKGNGAGGFIPQPEFDLGFQSGSKAIGDFNGDGRPDIVAVMGSEGQHGISAFLNDGTGGFGAPVSTPFGREVFSLGAVIADDFDGDGKTDVVIRTSNNTSSTDTGMILSIATTDGGFSEPIIYHPSVLTTAMATGDFNHDGLPDILSMNNRGSLTIVSNRGGDFNAPRGFISSPPNQSFLQYSARDLKSADLNGDGALDMVVAASGISRAAIMFGAGRNKFSDPVSIGSAGTGGGQIAIEIQDFNNDGKPDLALLNSNPRDVLVLLGDGQGGFTPSATISAGVNANRLTSADFNNDGNLDLVVRGESSGLALYRGDGQGGFTQIATGIGGNIVNVFFTSGDFNGDEASDLAIFDDLQSGTSGGLNIMILPGDGQGGFGQPSNVRVQERLSFLKAEDLNLDGRDDLIYSHQFIANAVFVVLSNPGGGFDSPVAYQVGAGTRSVVTTDINNDGKLDLISASFDTGTVSLLLGDGVGGFRQQAPLPVFDAPGLIVTGDFDRDGRIDLAIPRSGAPVIAIINNKSMCIPQSGGAPASSASGK